MTAATRRSAARPARGRSHRASQTARAAGGGSRTRRRSAASTVRSRPAASSTSSMPSSATTPTARGESVKLGAEAREVVLGEAQAVLAMVADEERRGRLASLVAAADDGEVAGEEAQAL